MTDLGKNAKYNGDLHPRDLRRIDREPPKPSQGVTDRPKLRRRYGFQYHTRYKRQDEATRWRKVVHWSWYDSEKKRDQAMAALAQKGDPYREKRDFKKLDRAVYVFGEGVPNE